MRRSIVVADISGELVAPLSFTDALIWRHHVPEDRNPELYHCENVKTHLNYVIVCIILDVIFDLSWDNALV